MKVYSFVITSALAVITLSQRASAQPTPMMGWSSWNTYRININAPLICSQADAMVDLGLKDAGYNYINIDDGFFGYRDSTGLMHSHPVRFPEGSMKQVSDHIHGLGLKAGIYSDAGGNTCGSIGDGDKNGIGAGLWRHVAQDANLYFNEWGYDFIKIDYCGARLLALEEEKTYTAIADTIRQVAGHPVYINVCRWGHPGTWVSKIAGSWRISGDIYDAWESVKDIIRRNMYLSAYASPGHFNDMDMLEIGRSLSKEEEVTHFGMWCIMSSPLLIGCDLTTIPARSLQLLTNRELIALNQDPLGLQAYVADCQGEGYVLVKDILKANALTRAVALYNPSDEVCHFDVDLAEKLQLGGKVKVRDLVQCRDLPTVTDGVFSADVPAHGTIILRMEAQKRLERTLYEAECAYLPTYNETGRVACPRYDPEKVASGGMIVSDAGGREGNDIVWNNVRSLTGGDYTLTVKYYGGYNDYLTVTVNGEKTTFYDFATPEYTPGELVLPVKLNKGDNVITIGSDITWTPDIDYISLKKNE